MSQGPWIKTYNGHKIDLLNPKFDDIDAVDIAHHLSLINRFTGATRKPWSVGQHSVVGSILAEVIYPEVKWLSHAFILHDATEAYLGDVSSPLKSLLPEYKAIELKHKATIEWKFSVSLGGTWEKTVDARMLTTERSLFMADDDHWSNGEEPPFTFDEFYGAGGKRIDSVKGFWDYLWTPWEPEETEFNFLARMEKLGL